MDSKMRNPVWWTDKNASAWGRVKGALQRDWEQTKHDFSRSSGQRLNQNVADTVKQSVGSEPVPPLGVKTRPTDPEVAAKDAEKAREDMTKATTKAGEAVARWQDAEQDVCYGYSVRSQYPADLTWDDQLEGKLRREWDALGTGRTWEVSRYGIRCGWDYASRNAGEQREAA